MSIVCFKLVQLQYYYYEHNFLDNVFIFSVFIFFNDQASCTRAITPPWIDCEMVLPAVLSQAVHILMDAQRV